MTGPTDFGNVVSASISDRVSAPTCRSCGSGAAVGHVVNAAIRLIVLCAGLVTTVLSTEAGATALYNRQTGQPCAACHTAPPELTPFGRRFMLNGFTMSGGKTGIPLSAYFEAGFTTTSKDVPTPRPGLNANDNLELQKVKLISGGAITDTIGAFAEVVYYGIDDNLRLGNVDVRHADSATVGKHDLVYGITLNNNPGFQDPWNSTLARTWPYARTLATPMPRTSALLDGPLAQRAVAVTGYGFIDDAYYVELGGYHKIDRDTQDTLGIDPGNSRTIEGIAPYARIAYEAKVPGGTLTVGASMLDADLSHPGGLGTGTDSVLNLGLDALYQWGRGPHEVTVRAAANRERWSLDSSVAQGLATNTSNHLNNLKLSASYLNGKRYSGTIGYFRRTGSTDALFFGTRNGKPDTEGFQFDAFMINPFFPPPSWHPGMRTRIGITYTAFTRFDGAKHNYDGNGRDASDNNTTFLYFLWAF